MAKVNFKRDFYDSNGTFWIAKKGPYNIEDASVLSALPSDATVDGVPFKAPSKEEVNKKL
jgi:hypothetical protein